LELGELLPWKSEEKERARGLKEAKTMTEKIIMEKGLLCFPCGPSPEVVLMLLALCVSQITSFV